MIGWLIRHQRLPEQLAQRVAQEGAGWTLLIGGVLFVAGGIAGLADPPIMSSGISTGIHVHNLDQLGIGTLLVALVIVVAAVTIAGTVHQLRRLPTSEEHQPPTPPGKQTDSGPNSPEDIAAPEQAARPGRTSGTDDQKSVRDH